MELGVFTTIIEPRWEEGDWFGTWSTYWERVRNRSLYLELDTSNRLTRNESEQVIDIKYWTDSWSSDLLTLPPSRDHSWCSRYRKANIRQEKCSDVLNAFLCCGVICPGAGLEDAFIWFEAWLNLFLMLDSHSKSFSPAQELGRLIFSILAGWLVQVGSWMMGSWTNRLSITPF